VANVTASEVRKHLNKMSSRKAADNNGVVAELLKEGSDMLLEIVAAVFSDILSPTIDPPAYWKETRMKVLFKKGDVHLAENYRPIAIMPILYKLFSKVLCNRVEAILEGAQTVDQAGFRPGFGCEDHLFAITILAEKMNEFQRPLWVVAVDFTKAFDTVHQHSIWQALQEQGVPDLYISVLMKLYDGQVARVQTDCLSREFSIARGTKQGDPISPILFNAVLEKALREVKKKWAARRAGIQVGYGKEGFLTNLRFADDILLIGRSLAGVRRMLADLIDEARNVGLEVHMGKTKILSNGIGRECNLRESLVNDTKIEILSPEASTMYSGRALNLVEPHDAELKHRMARA
jgi:hypothetical protein